MLSGTPGFDDSLVTLVETTPFPEIQLFEEDKILGHTPVLDSFLRHWGSRRQGSRLPTRADLEPQKLGRHLPHAVLMDVIDTPGEFASFRLQVRLIGSHVAESYGEITGQDIGEMANRAAARRIYRMSALAIERRRPVLSRVRGFAAGREHMEAFALYMPLRADGDGIAKLFVAVDVRLLSETE